MGEHTHISWCDHTWNPWIGCTKVSPACDGCYAENLMDARYGRVQWGGPGKGAGSRSRTSASTWNDPFRWHRKAEKAGSRPFVFCASLADIFDNQVPAEWRRDAFDVMRRTPRLVYLLLTKRPQNIARLAAEAGGLPPNAAIGTTVEDQKRANMNIPALLEAKAALRPLFAFLSCEPLLGPIDLTRIDDGAAHRGVPREEWGPVDDEDSPPSLWWDALTGERTIMHGGADGEWSRYDDKLDWIITGGETDQGAHKARPTHPDWFRGLRDQAAHEGVPFHHKQNGEWVQGDDVEHDGIITFNRMHCFMSKVGKALSGRLLDGVLHDARPEVPHAR